ncbi:MAG: hypothetical protein IKX19_07340 [Clostridia bacterium]|nr:hypothetical protein [Clostridia bacterium]
MKEPETMTNTKKSRNLFFAVVAVFLSVTALTGCGRSEENNSEKGFPLHPDVLLGKSKNEVIVLSMELAERTSSAQVRFAAQDDHGHFCEYPYSSKAEAEQDERLLKSDVWEVFYVTEKTLVGAHDKCIEITFEDGRVSMFEIKTISDGF